MTKTIYSLTPVNSSSNYSSPITDMIASHNEGKAAIDFDVIMGYCKGDFARWHTIRKQPTFKLDPETGIMEIWEDGKLSCTIHEKMINVLEPTKEDKNSEQN